MAKVQNVNGKQAAFMDTFQTLLSVSEQILMPDEICACAQHILGKYAACHDDVIMNDPIKKGVLAKLAVECNEHFAKVDPLKGISKVNFDKAYDDHKKDHEEERAKLKAEGKVGDELLEKVCESYKKSKED